MLEPPAAENIGAATHAGLSASSDLMAALALQKLHPPQSAESRLLEERIRTALCLLIATQQPDGGWLVRGRAASPEVNALAYWSLVLADKAGYEVPRETLEASLGNIRQGLASNPDGDSAAKAILVHTLAITGQGDFSLANQLLRDRKSLSPLGRAYLALALVRMDRKDAAAEVLKQLPTDEKDAGGRSRGYRGPSGNCAGPARPRHGIAAGEVAARFHPQPPPRLALDSRKRDRPGRSCRGRMAWARTHGPGATSSRNHRQRQAAQGTETRSADPTQIIEAPAAMLVKGKQEIALHVTDQQASALARIAYRATLSGVDPAENVSGSSAAWQVERSYEPPLMEVDGQTIPRGFTSISGYWFSAAFSNRMTQLPAARHGFVELTVRRNRGAEEKEAIAWSTGRPELHHRRTAAKRRDGRPFLAARRVRSDGNPAGPNRHLSQRSRAEHDDPLRARRRLPRSESRQPDAPASRGQRCAAGRRAAEGAGRASARREVYRPLPTFARRVAGTRHNSQATRRRGRRHARTSASFWKRGTASGTSASPSRSTSRPLSPSCSSAWAAPRRRSSCSTARRSRRSGPRSRSRLTNS